MSLPTLGLLVMVVHLPTSGHPQHGVHDGPHRMDEQVDLAKLDLHLYVPLFFDGIRDPHVLYSAIATQERHPS